MLPYLIFITLMSCRLYTLFYIDKRIEVLKLLVQGRFISETGFKLFIRNSLNFSKVTVPFYISISRIVWGYQLLHILANTWYYQSFYWYFIVFIICIFLMTNDVDHIFMWFLAIHMSTYIIAKDPDWGQEEKGTTEDEMVGWYHRLNAHGFGWTPGVSDGQRGLGCCGQTRLSEWTDNCFSNLPSWSLPYAEDLSGQPTK